MTITKETAIELAKQAGFDNTYLKPIPEQIERLCNLAVAHAQKEAEPCAWMDMVTVNLVREGINKHKARELANHFYTHPAHDDTALLREALEWFDAMRVGAMSRNNAEQLADEVSAALRERLGEKV